MGGEKDRQSLAASRSVTPRLLDEENLDESDAGSFPLTAALGGWIPDR